MYTARFVWPINADAMDLSESVATKTGPLPIAVAGNPCRTFDVRKVQAISPKKKDRPLFCKPSRRHTHTEKYKVSGTFHFECRSYSSLREALTECSELGETGQMPPQQTMSCFKSTALSLFQQIHVRHLVFNDVQTVVAPIYWRAQERTSAA